MTLQTKVNSNSRRSIRIFKIQGCGIDAVSQARRLRAILEYMAKVRATGTAGGFLSHHSMTRINDGSHRITLQRQPEARPAGSGIVFVLRAKQIGIATNASITAIAFVVNVLAGKWPLRSFSLRHAKLLVT